MKSAFGRTIVYGIASDSFVGCDGVRVRGRSAGRRSSRRQSRFPRGPGAADSRRACSTCHVPDAITTYHFTNPDEYADIVDEHDRRRRPGVGTEKPVLVDYLFDNLRRRSPPPAPPTRRGSAGKAILETACTTCHGLDGMENHVYDNKEPYKSLVEA